MGKNWMINYVAQLRKESKKKWLITYAIDWTGADYRQLICQEVINEHPFKWMQHLKFRGFYNIKITPVLINFWEVPYDFNIGHEEIK